MSTGVLEGIFGRTSVVGFGSQLKGGYGSAAREREKGEGAKSENLRQNNLTLFIHANFALQFSVNPGLSVRRI